MRILVITVSDRAFKGIYEDKSGDAIINLLKEYFIKENLIYKIEKIIIPDEYDIILNSQIPNLKKQVLVWMIGQSLQMV